MLVWLCVIRQLFGCKSPAGLAGFRARIRWFALPADLLFSLVQGQRPGGRIVHSAHGYEVSFLRHVVDCVKRVVWIGKEHTKGGYPLWKPQGAGNGWFFSTQPQVPLAVLSYPKFGAAAN